MPHWSPAQYEKFGGHRARPFFELVARVEADPDLVVDLGCGNGPLTLSLAQRWPQARIIGVDSSASMLERARELDPDGRVEWVEADVASYEIDGRPDVIVTNATLQWVPVHRELIPRWADSLADGGWFAMQVPGNFGAPSHRLLRELTRAEFGAQRAAQLTREAPVAEPVDYARLLAACGLVPDAWETTYVQVLDCVAGQRHPVLEWMKGTALRPVMDELGDRAEEFLDELDQRLAHAYPPADGSVYFPFRRIFAVGHRG